jgi:hypothetical protein
MSTARTPRDKRHVDHGGLPPDEDLGAFAAAAEGAFGAPAAAARPLTAVPDTAAPAIPAPVPPSAVPAPGLEDAPAAAPVATAQAAARPVLADEPDDDPDDDEVPAAANSNLIRQATINVGADVAQRFRRYQDAFTGSAPSNAEVVFRALDACEDRYSEVVASRRPQPKPGRRFGSAPVPGRRATSEARLSSQINYRPTYGELAQIRRLRKQAGARSVSAFLDAVLDAFLPPLKGTAAAAHRRQR